MANRTVRRVLTRLVLGLVCAACLTGARCGPDEPWRPGRPLPRDKVKVGVLYIDTPIDGYSLAHETGILRMQHELGLGDDQIVRRFNVHESDPLLIEHEARACIAAGANIIFATSWGYMDVCEKLAGEFPGVVFAHATGYKYNDSNFTNYFGRIYLARYLSGIVAGMATRSGKIGYVAAKGRENSEVTGGINAFALGVESANPGATVLVRVINSWYDPAGEGSAAARLIEAGCDVVSQHCDTAEPQLQAERLGALGVGYNTDMSRHAPDAVLTSVIWHWGAYYSRLVRSVMDGSFTTTPFFGGLKEGMIDITPLSPALTDAAMQAAVDAVRARMERGEFNVFDGELPTNDGRTVGRPGATLSDAAIATGMDWYYHNVAEL